MIPRNNRIFVPQPDPRVPSIAKSEQTLNRHIITWKSWRKRTVPFSNYFKNL